jgi:hypothetical protein
MSGILRGQKDEHTVEAIAEIEGRKIKFQATFKVREWADASAVSTDISNMLINDSAGAWQAMENAIRNDLVRWSNLQGDGGEVEYNDDNLDAALKIYGYLSGLYRGWNAAQMLQKGANSKN